MFESGDNMTAVAALGAMIPIVKQDHLATRSAGADDTREPLNQALGRLGFPIKAFPRPHHDAPHPRFANFTVEEWTSITVGWTHPARRRGLNRSGDRDLASRQFVTDGIPGLKYQIWMRIRVIAEQMAAHGNFLSQGRTIPDKFSD